MDSIICEKCGGAEFAEENGYRVCLYCGTKYVLNSSDVPKKDTNIALHEDVVRLLNQCKSDPKHASMYASLILDIDPTNTEALRYL